MRRLVLLLLLAGCAPELPLVGSPDVPESCREQVYSDPAVRNAMLMANSQSQGIRLSGLALQKQVEARAVRRCLSGEGVIPPGGVEPLRLN